MTQNAVDPRLIEEILARISGELRQALGEIRLPAPPPPTTPKALAEGAARLRKTHSQTEILKTLLSSINDLGHRGALFLVRPDFLEGWEGVGFDSDPGLAGAIRGVRILREQALVRAALAGESPVLAGGLDAPIPDFGQSLPKRALMMPLRVQEKLAGLVYADPGRTGAELDSAGVQTLVELAGLAVERLVLGKTPAIGVKPAAPAAFRAVPAAAPLPAETVAMPRPTAQDLAPHPVVDKPLPLPGPITPAAPAPPPPAVSEAFAKTLADLLPSRPAAEPPLAMPEALDKEPPLAMPESIGAPTGPQFSDSIPTFTPKPAQTTGGFPGGSGPAAPPIGGGPPARPGTTGGVRMPTIPPGRPAGPVLDRVQTGGQETPSIAWPTVPGGPPNETEDARRYARLLMEEILLYHGQKVEEGRHQRDLRYRLSDELSKAMVLYEMRVPERVRQSGDYFEEAMIRVLAGGDAGALGD